MVKLEKLRLRRKQPISKRAQLELKSGSLGNLRILVSLLLVCSPVLLLSALRVNGQTLTTSTSTQDITMSTIITAYSTIQRTSTTQEQIRYEVWPYDYDNLTSTFSLWLTNTWPPVVVGFTDEEFPCLYYDYFVFNATAGQEIKGEFTTEQEGSVGFYVLNSAQFQRFGYSGCEIGNWGWDVYEFGPAGNFDWSVPETGRYTFLFLSRGFYGGHIHFTAQAYSAVETSSVSTYAVTSTCTLQSSMNLVSTQTPASAPNSIGTHDLLPVSVLIIAMLTVGVGSFVKARHKRVTSIS